ncbi:cytochrome c oxidase accessory protein CcoG [Leeia aquatica]|uniref:Cytochrome c oxidase accessory protein CcoG n=1 Tax=Leeia aquatica TaxID=2725557 RepID=A0A847SDU8_9NEIS|nr:cytochrome c oxidase accessory protein CcoG [Leeia aquatica]NLR74122.1 cytochrome c oxidase accessory protein CcoG [Leeia aquatica]
MTQSFKNIPIKTQPAPPLDDQDELYEVRKKIHPRAISGLFATWRWIAVWVTQLVFYGLPWLSWEGRPAVLFDLDARKFYIFDLIFWPQDFIYLALLLMLCAFGLFWWTAIAGRLWCGYACPQTVYTSIFLWIEAKVEGNHLARQKLDAAPMSGRKLRLRATKHAIWIAFSLWTGFTFVSYFTPLTDLFRESRHGGLGPWELFWICFYGFATYGNAGFLREQVCKYMCPYARFQGVMFDRDTLIISYDTERGEPRGGRKKSANPQELGLGSCVDCSICVQVCPTGIDIRNGLQSECIGCAACIDACDQVMEKMNYPKGLIRYTTENALEHRYAEDRFLSHILRPRIIIYTVILAVLVTSMVWTLATRNPLKVDVVRDRNALVRETVFGQENAYTLNLINTDDHEHLLMIKTEALPQAELLSDQALPVRVAAGSTQRLTLRVRTKGTLAQGSNPLIFVVQAVDQPTMQRREKTSFQAAR